MATVYVRDGELEKALKIFRSKVNTENILGEYKKRMWFTSNSEKMRRMKEKQRSKALKKIYREKRLEEKY